MYGYVINNVDSSSLATFYSFKWYLKGRGLKEKTPNYS